MVPTDIYVEVHNYVMKALREPENPAYRVELAAELIAATYKGAPLWSQLCKECAVKQACHEAGANEDKTYLTAALALQPDCEEFL